MVKLEPVDEEKKNEVKEAIPQSKKTEEVTETQEQINTDIESTPSPPPEIPVETAPSPPPDIATIEPPVEKNGYFSHLPGLPTMRTLLAPAEFLREFLTHYSPPIKKDFVRFYCDHVAIRNDLPSSPQLLTDLKTIDSGIQQIQHASYIAEIYAVELGKYLEQQRQNQMAINRPYQGVSVENPYPIDPYYQTPQRLDPQYPSPSQLGGGYPSSSDYRITQLEDELRRRDDERRKEDSEKSRKAQSELFELQLLETQKEKPPDDIERLIKLNELLNPKKDSEDPLVTQMTRDKELLSQKIQNLEAERSKRIESDIAHFRTELGRIYEENKTLRENQGDLSIQDVELEKIQKDFDLEMKKLDKEEEGRKFWGDTAKSVSETFGNALGMGLAGRQPGAQPGQTVPTQPCPHCGVAITFPEGVTSGACPHCNGPISIETGIPQKATLPTEETQGNLSSDILEQACPHCNSLTVSSKFTPEIYCSGCQKRFPNPNFVGPPETTTFTVDQPLREEPPPAENWMPYPPNPRISECPSCKTPLTIPSGLETIECPQCHKYFKVVSEGPPPLENIPKEVPKVPIEVPPEVPKAIPHESPEKVSEETPIEVPPEVPKEEIPPSISKDTGRIASTDPNKKDDAVQGSSKSEETMDETKQKQIKKGKQRKKRK